MAPIGAVFKNGLVFAILTAGIMWVSAFFFMWGIHYSMDEDTLQDGWNYIFFGLLILVIPTSIILHKTLSDTIEDGMYEF